MKSRRVKWKIFFKGSLWNIIRLLCGGKSFLWVLWVGKKNFNVISSAYFRNRRDLETSHSSKRVLTKILKRIKKSGAPTYLAWWYALPWKMIVVSMRQLNSCARSSVKKKIKTKKQHILARIIYLIIINTTFLN